MVGKLVGFIVALSLACAGSSLVAADPTSAPLKVRQLAILNDPDAAGGGVWLATAALDRAELEEAERILAENKGHAGARIFGMSSQGKAKYYPNLSRVRVDQVDRPWYFVTFVAGEDKGSKGWVQAKFLGRVPPARRRP
jgi:hypothetical protein